MRYPHWRIGDITTSSQITAWKTSIETGLPIQFYFYEDEYDALDWTKEPTDSWYDLCIKKCILLRQKYKKLSLFYSAGRDSHHILSLFWQSGILLDEIVLINYPGISDRTFQLESHIIPQVREFVRKYPKTKVSFITLDDSTYASFFSDDWVEKPLTASMAGLYTPTSYDMLVDKLCHGRSSPDTGFLFGNDKPRILLRDGKFYSTVIDKTLEYVITGSPNFEMFYYSPDMPELHLKQVWMTLNHLTTHFKDKLTDSFLIDYCGNAHGLYYDDLCVSCGRGPAWNILADVQNGASKRPNGYDPILYEKLQTDLKNRVPHANNFNEISQYLARTMPMAFNKEDPFYGTKGVYGKMYYLKDA